MQDGRDTGRALKPAAGEIEQTLCCGIKEQFIERSLVTEQKRMQLVWKWKDYVVVRHRKKPPLRVLQPPAGMDGMAAREVPVARSPAEGLRASRSGSIHRSRGQRAGPANSHALENAFLPAAIRGERAPYRPPILRFVRFRRGIGGNVTLTTQKSIPLEHRK